MSVTTAFASTALVRSTFHGAVHARSMRSAPRAQWPSQRRRARLAPKCTGRPQEPPAARALASRIKSAVESRVLLGNELNAELAAILSVYFVQGVLAMPRLAISFFLKDALELAPAAVAQLTAVATLPWVIKPLYGFMSDCVPIAGSRRRAYLVVSGAVGAASWAWLATAVADANSALLAMLFSSLSVAIADVVADSLVVERVRESQVAGSAGALQTLCWGSTAIGGLLAAAVSGPLLSSLGARGVFGLTATLPAAIASLASLVAEQPAPPGSGTPKAIMSAARERTGILWSALTARRVALPVAFVFLWQSTPTPDAALFFFQTNVLNFGPDFLGVVRFASSAAALAGLYCYQKFWRSLPVKTLMRAAALASVPLSLTQLILVSRLNVAWGISDRLFALTDSAVLTALGQVAFMPTLVLAARLCPPGIEGTLFAALMSIYNASGALSNQLGALLTHALRVTESDFTNLGWLVTICSFSSLIALPLLGFLDAAPDEQTGSANGPANSESTPQNGMLLASAKSEEIES